MSFVNRFKNSAHYMLSFLKWGLLGILMGVIGGLLGAVFFHALKFVTQLRQDNNWLIYLLPIGGIVTIGIYRLFKLQSNRGTNEVIESVLQDRRVSSLITPAIFTSTAITHLLGGSAGREGAALQMGGSVASLLCEALRLKKKDRTILIMCGMTAVFAGVFGTPLTACFFTMEFESVGTIFSPALFPCIVSALVASKLSLYLGVHGETGIQINTVSFTLDNSWKIVVLAISISVIGIIMCYLFHKAEHLAHEWIKNPLLRIVVGSAVIIGLTLLVGDQRFNGAGMEMALGALEGNADWYSFILKMLFTAITLAAGFKGGEIVPTFCIGATFGCVMGTLLGLDPTVAAALGLIGLFACTTNSPLASIVLSMEMFGGANLPVFALVCVITFVLSGPSKLYASQLMRFPKLSLEQDK
ncbi:MAG: chloride channel protein [Clostridia bacterium]|nr:chloride channel protein [Clostridia bacterium]